VTTIPTPAETEATLRELVEVQSKRLVEFADFKRSVAQAVDPKRELVPAQQVLLVRQALEAIR
jgi:hypothetical protein